jgi:hypothetical protein
MSLSADERHALQVLTESRPIGQPAIHYLAFLYQRSGAGDAGEVTDVIARATCNRGLVGEATQAQFSGLVAGSDSRGFRPELADPNPANPQTGHFLSFVVWARDGISEVEYASAIGHELSGDARHSYTLPFVNAYQWWVGTDHQDTLRDIVMRQPCSPSGRIDYAALDADLATHGWDSAHLLPHEGGSAEFTGNSLPDLRCTVAGLVMGNLIHIGNLRQARQVAHWMEINVLDAPLPPLAPSLYG